MDRLERAVDGTTQGDLTELSARYQNLATELDRAAAEFATAATAAGESPPVRFMSIVRSYQQNGADLIKLAAARRELLAGYMARFEQLNTRMQKSLEHAWTLFGGVVTTETLRKLSSDVDDLRHQYVEFSSADFVDSATFDPLGASEAALTKLLTQERDAFSHAKGHWYTKTQDDLQAMSTTRRALLQIDHQRKAGARKFGDDASAIAQILARMGKTETYVARNSATDSAARQLNAAAAGADQPTSATGGASASGQPASAAGGASASQPTFAVGSTSASTQPTSAAGGTNTSSQPASAAGGANASRQPASAAGGANASGQPTSAAGGTNASGQPTSAVGSTSASGHLTSAAGGTNASGQPTSAAGGTNASGQPMSAAGVASASGQPKSAARTASGGAQPKSAAGVAGASGQPMSTAGAASASGQPMSTAGAASGGGQPTSTAGAASAGAQPTSAANAASAGAQPTSAAGVASDGGQPTSAAAAASGGGQPTSAAAAASDGGQPTSAAAAASDGAQPTSAAAAASAGGRPTSAAGGATFKPQNQHHKPIITWLSGGALLLIVYVSAWTALNIVRPVRRLISASARIAKGESGVTMPRGGIRELDTLALTFNDMAAQLAVAQEAARDQQHLLESKVAERTLQLQQLAQLDPLTQLANRRHFFTLLHTAIETAARESRLVGVFFLDVDNFKSMNDSLGHEFGDHVLQIIARRLAESIQSFGFAARLGGDEFTVVYESASDIEAIRMVGLQLIQAFQEPMQLDSRDLVVSISAGASVFPEHAQNVEALLRAADAALYEAKALGRGQLALFAPALLEAATERFTTEQGLLRALDRGEFELVFQPEVNLQTCEVELVEALLRWRRPNGRLAEPSEFLAVAEASGLITQINDWVLNRVIETAARWHHGDWPAVRLAINVSSRQLFDNSFVEQVQELLEEYDLPPRCIEIELTENVLQTGSATIASLRRLRAHGIAIALDDFGSGFSSLASLEQLPLTRIKLDRSLIASIDTSARSASIAKAIIQLCQGLGLAITAEGIERLEQLAPLVGYVGLYAQGYLIARPQSVDDLLPVIADLPAVTRGLIRTSISHLPQEQLVEALPFVTVAMRQ